MSNEKLDQTIQAALEDLSTEAREWIPTLKAARVYQGNDPGRGRQADRCIKIFSALFKGFGSLQNSRTNDIIERRFMKQIDTKSLGE